MRPRFQWRTGSRSLTLGQRTLIVGIVNVTPDSFFDGGLHSAPEPAIDHALRLLDEGADILDIGGESTRPGAHILLGGMAEPKKEGVSEAEEMRRVIPVVTAVKRLRPEAALSVDTYKSGVARAAVDAGAEIINDVSGLRWDPAMRETLAALRCGVVLMHVRGQPENWGSLPPVDDVMGLVCRELRQIAKSATSAGVQRERLVLDPGFGFGKRLEENYPLLARFEELHGLGFPLLSGTSRKAFIGRAVRDSGEIAPPGGRLFGSVAAAVVSILKGAHLVRVHDVKSTIEAAAVADVALSSAECTG